MKDNKIFLFPAALVLPGLGLISPNSQETWILGFVSFGLLFLFFYTIKLMGARPDVESQSEEIKNQSNANLIPVTNSQTMEVNSSYQNAENIESTVDSQPLPTNKIELDTNAIRGFRKDRFKKDTLGPMVKHFLKEFPQRSKIDNALFSIFDENEFHEFLIQRGRLFIDCDTDAVLEVEESIILNLLQSKASLTDKGRKLSLSIATPSRIYGALYLESLSGFSNMDALIFQAECNRFAFEWEMRREYELAILDPITLVYNNSHFKTILTERFMSGENLGLFLLEITSADNYEDFITFLAEFYKFPIYRLNNKRLAFFLEVVEIEGIGISMQNAIQELDKQNFYAEFILAYSLRSSTMNSAGDWEEDAHQQLFYAKKKSPVLQNSLF